MKALVSRDEIKKHAEYFPNFYDCPPYVFVEVLPLLTDEAAARLQAASKREQQRKPKAKKR
jgi:hypothetical protein